MNLQIPPLCYSWLLAAALLQANTSEADMHDITRIYRQTPTIAHFEICTGGGCAEAKPTSLTDEEWAAVAKVFEPPAENAHEERVLIAQAIGALENIVGEKTGTATDRAGTFGNSHYSGQLDCNDEAINSTTYMRLLKAAGWMPRHEIEDTRTRSFFFNGWPHSTAVMHDIATGERFAVDSWFYDNGHPATIVPFAQWKSGYIPADSTVTKGAN